MCGIAGIYSPREQASTSAVGAMLDSMAHRGPDDSGQQALANGGLILGHLRLSILDLSPLGHQPMALPDKKTWLTYNGEIYNFREIREDLRSLGWSFRSESDTEVILASYAQWGLNAIERYRGMFAFALWDDVREQLHLVRDRFGVKPLYYALNNGRLAFASELRALNIGGYTNRNPDPTSLAEYVQFGYVTSPRSIFGDVRTVRPGTICTIDESLAVREHEYWNSSELYVGKRAADLRYELSVLSEDALLDRVERELQCAFEYRMVSDVPVGLFLSGGIDSSLLAAILSRRSGIKLNTFTIGYGTKEFDERDYAREVARELGARYVELDVPGSAALDVVNELPGLLDEPMGDSSIIPTLLVSRLARQEVKVALSADGADELFGGYARYDYCARFVRRDAPLLRALYLLSAEVLDQLPAAVISRAYALTRGGGAKFAAINDKVKKFVRMCKARDASEAYEAATSEWTAAQARELLCGSPVFSGARSAFDSVRGANVLDQFMYHDLTRYLPGDLLTKVDRASMSVSLEVREPFLDHEAARVAAALPPEWKIRAGRSKYVLRRLLQRYFRPDLFDRPKQGFSVPLATWLRGPLRELLLQELSEERIRQLGILDPQVASGAIEAFLANNREGCSPASAWIILQLQQWAGKWLRAPQQAARSTDGVYRAT
jgi:asparagine synthase (glutamine-hydrolysing)